jgi:GldM C-terminal domain
MIFQVLLKYQIIILIFLFLTSKTLLSQYRLGNHLNEKSISTLSSSKGLLYVGIDNLLKIDNSIIKDFDTINIESNNGSIVPDSNHLILIVPDRPGKVRLNLTGIRNKDSTEIGYKYFNVIGIPDPMLMINNIPINTPCTIPRKVVLSCDSLGIYFSDDIAGSDKWMKISKFILGYNYGGFYISHLNPTNILTNETKQILQKIGPDREISILLTTESEGMVYKELPIYRITIY